MYRLVPAHDLNVNVHGYRRVADSRCLSVKTYDLAHVHGRLELHLFDRDCDHLLLGRLRTLDRTRQVDIAKYDATEYSPLTIRVLWLKNHSYRGIPVTQTLAHSTPEIANRGQLQINVQTMLTPAQLGQRY